MSAARRTSLQRAFLRPTLFRTGDGPSLHAILIECPPIVVGRQVANPRYAIDTPLDIPTKTECVIQSLTRTTTSSPGSQITLAFSSAAKFPLATPQWVAKGIGAPSFGLGMEGVNARLAHWLIRQAAEGRRPRAIVMADFYEYTGSGTAGLGSLLGALNFVQ